VWERAASKTRARSLKKRGERHLTWIIHEAHKDATRRHRGVFFLASGNAGNSNDGDAQRGPLFERMIVAPAGYAPTKL
jgi:hypothetical protein